MEVPCTNPTYADGLTRDIHDAIVKKINVEGKPVNPLSLARKRVAMREEIESMYKSKKLIKRLIAARLESVSSKPKPNNKDIPSQRYEIDPVEVASSVVEAIPSFSVTKRSFA